MFWLRVLQVYCILHISFVAFLLLMPTRPQQVQIQMSAPRPTYQEIADEVNKADSINVDCRPSWNNLSPQEQIRRVNEVLNTPSAPDDVGRH